MSDREQERLVVPERMRTRTVTVGINHMSRTVTLYKPWTKLLGIDKGTELESVFMPDLGGILFRLPRES